LFFRPKPLHFPDHKKEEAAVADVKVQSEITGKVWAIEASVGDSLSEEDTIIVLESMKMEIPVVAPVDGKLKEILVAEGDAVAEGQDVAIMEA
jgi:acetyl-CoA carboxylase biotin carboxyl carrier protein